jgi:hypothetical protein
MRRLLITGLASLLALAVIAPAAAQGTTKVRAFQDLSLSGPFPGQFFVNVQYKDRNGNRKFTPRYAVGYRLQVQLSCDPGGETGLNLAGNAYAKYAYFKEKLRKGRFAHRFGSEVSESSSLKGDLSGLVGKRLKRDTLPKRTARVNGAFDVEDWDPNPGVLENCISHGSYSASPCKRKRSKRDPWPRWYREWKVPVCSVDL